MIEEELKLLSPYPSLRPGQLKIAKVVYLSIAQGTCTILEAPCGLGKTMASLMGIALSLRRNLAKRVLWLTRTNDESDKVIEEAKRLKNDEDVLRGISIRGKSSSCPYLREVNEELSHLACRIVRNENLCPYLDQEKIDSCVNSLSQELSLLTSIEIMQIAAKNRCCPIAVMKRLMKYCNMIALTYPFIFNYNVYRAYFRLLRLQDAVAIIDEAHNVFDAMIEYESKVIREITLCKAVDELSTRKIKLARPLEDLSSMLKSMIVKGPSQGVEIARDHIQSVIIKYFKDPLEYLNELKGIAVDIVRMRAVKGLTLRCPTYSAYAFLREALRDDNRVIWAYLDVNGEISLEVKPLTCDFAQIARLFRSVVLMSGTLSPIKGFAKILNLDLKSVKAMRYVKPKYGYVVFIVDPSISTSLKDRSEELYKVIVYKLKIIRSIVDGGLGIFLPSYTVLRALKSVGLKELMSGLVLIDDGRGASGMELFKRFKDYVEGKVKTSLVSVMGGRLTEGIDISSRLMPIAVIVGLPMPEPTPYNLRKVEKLRGLGFKNAHEIVFVEPAMRRVAQTVGRLIRNPFDEAVVILMDKRYTKNLIRKYMPRWLSYELRVADNPSHLLQEALSSLKLKVRYKQREYENAS
ncbi:MAG: ATP-dependent DNA helicase [Candidatus Nezhaarchaeales archaeon]